MNPVLIAIFVSTAFAAPAVAASVDFQPVAQELLSAVGVVLAGVASTAVGAGLFLLRNYIKAKTGLELEMLNDMRFEAWAENAVNYGIGTAQRQVAQFDLKVNMPDVVALSTQYALHQFPKLIRSRGLTQEEVERWLTAKVSAKIVGMEEQERLVKAGEPRHPF